MSGRRPEEDVPVPLMHERWRDVLFLHWRYEPREVADLLPAGLEPDLYDGAAWVSLTPFRVEHARPPLLPALPHISTYPETNLRTYVVGPNGSDGIWFFTLDVDSALTTALGRIGVGAPYRSATMSIETEDGVITYKSQRPDGGAGHNIAVRPRGVIDDPDHFTTWLTGRWRAWTQIPGSLATIAVRHEPWPLHHVDVLHLGQSLVAAHVAVPKGEPLAHFSPGVDASLGPPIPRSAKLTG